MKAKLIKVNDNQPDGGFYILRDLNGNPMALEGNLSLKNCQAIERGWDLIEEMCKLVDKKAEQSNTIDLNAYGQGCLDAFQKALELMGDKKFSEEDMGKAWSEGYHRKVDELNGNGLRYFDKFIQSLQQTEWDVTFNPDEKDSEECLILKRL